MEDNRLFRCLIGLILIVSAGFYLAASLAGVGMMIATPQPDTLLYCQAARSIVEGHPFSFSVGESVSTGTTSILYPFVLAMPYALGARGDSLLVVGFALNALFYLVFILGWALAFSRWIADRRVWLVASVVLALSGQPAYCAFAQSDAGLWMAVSALLAYALAAERRVLFGILMVLGPWIRPEGMVVAVAFTLILVVRRFLNAEVRRSSWIVAGLVILSAGGVFAFNYALTGHVQFSSVVAKGHFAENSFSQAIALTAQDVVRMIREIFLALPTSLPRILYSIPVLGGLFLCRGLVEHDWRGGRRTVGFGVMVLAAVGGCLTVALSGMQGSNVDRYLAWMMPIVILLGAEGAVAVGDNLKNRSLRWMPPGALVLFSAGGMVAFMCMFHYSSQTADRMRAFAVECDRAMPRESTVGSFASCGIAYEFSTHRLRHLGGIYSPEFAMVSDAARFETLRIHPELWFDYWFLKQGEISDRGGRQAQAFLGPVAFAGPDQYELRTADWSVFNRSRVVCRTPKPGLDLKARIEIGYEPDEKRFDYEIEDRYGRSTTTPFLEFDGEGTNLVFDACRLVIGGDRMTVPLAPGRDVVVEMRTKSAVSVCGRRHEFVNPITFNLEIDGRVIAPVSVTLAESGFCDARFVIPGSEIRKSPVRLGFLGDHVVGSYSFWQ